ncbi:MAG TPA: DUF2383 domain-containing protein [Coriobacteriia bacterium]|nr:DUF2383 domain-containing protein [Coriobacteriia bacterium]
MDTYGKSQNRDIDEIAEKLGDLLKLDVDAVRAYNEAIEKIEAQDTRSRLSTFRDDHERHVSELTRAIQGMGRRAPEPSPDFKGMLIEGMTKLRSSMGDEQALKAMHQNEETTNKAYEKAANEQYWPTDVRGIIERGLADERAHIQWIDQRLTVTAGAGHSSGETTR